MLKTSPPVRESSKLLASSPGRGIRSEAGPCERSIGECTQPSTPNPSSPAYRGTQRRIDLEKMVRTVVSPFPTSGSDSLRKRPVGPRLEVGGELHHEDVVVQVSVKLRIDLVGELQDGAGI